MLWELLFATDSASNQPFLLNPALVQSKNLSLGLAQLNSSSNYKVTASNSESVQKTNISNSKQGLSINSPLGPGFSAGVYGLFSSKEYRSTVSDNNRYQTLTLDEHRTQREAGLRMSIQITPAFNVGAQLRYSSFNTDVIGTFNVAPTDRTSYKSSIYGGGIGGAFVNKEWTVSGCYFSPLRGKSEIGPESKVTNEPGFTLLQGHYEFAKEMHIGLSYMLWNHDKDELEVTSTTPQSNGRTQMFLKGVSPDANYHHNSMLAIGGDFPILSSTLIRVSAIQEKGFFLPMSDTAETPTAPENKTLDAYTYSGRTALVMSQSTFEAQIGANYGKRKFSRTLSDGNGAFTMSQGLDVLNTFIAIKLNF